MCASLCWFDTDRWKSRRKAPGISEGDFGPPGKIGKGTKAFRRAHRAFKRVPSPTRSLTKILRVGLWCVGTGLGPRRGFENLRKEVHGSHKGVYDPQKGVQGHQKGVQGHQKGTQDCWKWVHGHRKETKGSRKRVHSPRKGAEGHQKGARGPRKEAYGIQKRVWIPKKGI